jgi:hypothetical protein
LIAEKGVNGLKKYNYFDDDETDFSGNDINSLISSFDAPKEVKKEEIDRSLKIIEEDQKEQRSKEKAAEKKAKKEAAIAAVKAFSKKSGEKIVTVAHNVKQRKVSEELENMSDHKKRNVTIALIFVFLVVFVLLVFTTLHAVSSENKRISKFNTDAGKICSQYITKYGNCSYENLYSQYGIMGYRMKGLCFVREVDFNDDNVSELLLCYNDGGEYYTEVWGYNNDKSFVNFYHAKATQTDKMSNDVWITIYTKNNKYYIGTHSGDNLEKVALYGLKGTEFEKKYNADYDSAAQAFTVKKEVDATSFERVKLAVLVEEKALVTTEQVSKSVESFIGATGLSELIKNSQSIQNAYYTVVDEYNQTYGKAKVVKKNGLTYIDGLAAVDLVDFNGDGKDELVLVYRKTVKTRSSDAKGNYVAQTEDKYYIEIYRYNGTKAVLIYKNENISNSLGDSSDMYYVIKKKNDKAYYCVNAFSKQNYGKIINASSTVFKYDGSQFTQQSKTAYRTRYGSTEYFINDDEVSKSKFEEKGYAVPYFDGTSAYDENTYTVSFLQRKRLKADNMDNRVNDTISTIRKLNSSYSGSTE